MGLELEKRDGKICLTVDGVEAELLYPPLLGKSVEEFVNCLVQQRRAAIFVNEKVGVKYKVVVTKKAGQELLFGQLCADNKAELDVEKAM